MPMNAKYVLSLPLPQPNDAEVATVREYLAKLLHDLWVDEEGFDSKRPFGNSGWQNDLYGPLIKAGQVWGKLDEDGYITDIDEDAAEKIIVAAIEFMCKG